MFKRSLIAATVLLLLSAGAAFATSATFNVTVTIRQPITVSCPAGTGDLDFGTVDATPSATYTVTPTSGAQAGAGATAHSANCIITGEATVTPTSVTVSPTATLVGPGTPATDITVTLTKQATAAFTGGSDNFFIGGSFSIPGGGQPSGTYTSTGTATLTVLY